MTTILKFKGADDEVVSVGRTTGLFGDKYSYAEDTQPTAEQMLKKALEFAYQGMRDNTPEFGFDQDDYSEGQYYSYSRMAAHLEMLIKEAKQQCTTYSESHNL